MASDVRAASKKHPNITVGSVRLFYPYGTHHAKLSMFESENALHVMVSTANLIPEDYELKTQGFYYCKAPLNQGLEEVSVGLFRFNLLFCFIAEIWAQL